MKCVKLSLFQFVLLSAGIALAQVQPVVAPDAPNAWYGIVMQAPRNPFAKGPFYKFETRNTSIYWEQIVSTKTPLPVLEIEQNKTLVLYDLNGKALSATITAANRKQFYHNGMVVKRNGGYYYQMINAASKSSAGWVSGKDLVSPLSPSMLANSQTEAGTSVNCPLGGCAPSATMQIDEWSKRLDLLRMTSVVVAKPVAPYTYGCPVGGSGTVQWTSAYNMSRKHPVTGQVKRHHGVDFSAPGSPPISAVSGGTVIQSGVTGGYGRRVAIQSDNNGPIMTYNHMKPGCALPGLGARVERGAKLGCMGQTGLSSGVHLHFEIFKTKADMDAVPKRSTDPMKLIDFRKACAGRFVDAR